MQCKSYTWVTRGTKTAQQKCRTKNCGTKIGGDPRTLGDGQVQKGQKNKNSGTKLVGTSGTLSASTERSAEQKVVEQKCWWGPLQTLSASSADLLVLALRVLEGSHQIFVPHFLVLHFCSTDLLVLALRV